MAHDDEHTHDHTDAVEGGTNRTDDGPLGDGSDGEEKVAGAGAGALGGAAVGTAVGGPVGTLVGGAIGAVGGAVAGDAAEDAANDDGSADDQAGRDRNEGGGVL